MKRKIGLVSDEGLGDVYDGSGKRKQPLNGSGSETERRNDAAEQLDADDTAS